MNDEKINNNSTGSEQKNQSIATIISFSVMGFGGGAALSFISAYGFYFYEVEVGLPIFFFTLAFIIYAIWDAVNDPLIGYLSDKPRFYTKRWGRRFPWILLGTIPVSFLFFLVMAPPDIDPVENAVIIFIWVVVFLCLFEFFSSLVYINQYALFPQKFRTDRDRRYTTGVQLGVQAMMLFFGMIVPPFFIVYGDKSSFLTAAFVIVLISIPFIILGIPGSREDKEMIERVLKSDEAAGPRLGFLKSMKKLLKNRNFIAMVIIYVSNILHGALLTASVIYYTRYVLQLGEEYIALILIPFLLLSIIGIPIWVFIIKKIGELKVVYIASIGLMLTLTPILFTTDLYWTMFVAAGTGFFNVGWNCADEPLFSRVIDEIVIEEKRHVEGTYNGVLLFLLRATAPIAIVIIAVTHILTGFDPAADVQTPLAVWGIRAVFALIPMIITVLGLLVFWKVFDLTSEKMVDIRAQLKELDL